MRSSPVMPDIARDTLAGSKNDSGFHAHGAGAVIRAASGCIGETCGDNNLRGNRTDVTAGVDAVSP